MVKIKLLSIVALMFFVAKTFSQIDSVNVDEIVVSANRAPNVYSQTSRVISIITKKELKNLPVQTIQDVLEYALNVDIRQRGSQGVQADVCVRGGSFDQTLILLNGVNINDPQTGHHNLDLPVNIDNIEKIEILQGPGSRVFGPNAFTGAINIITNNNNEDNNVSLSLMGGEHNFFSGSLSSSYKVDNITNYVSISRKKCDGYTNDTDFDVSNLFYHATSKMNFAKIDLQAGYTNKKFGANSFYTPKFPNQFEATRTTFINAKLTSLGKFKFVPNIYWRRHHDKFELFRNNPPAWYLGHNYHLTDVYGANINSHFNSKYGKTSFGAEYRIEHIYSNVLGELMNDTIAVPGEPNAFFTHSKMRNNLSFFVEHSVYLNKFSFSTGLLANYNSDFLWNYTPGIDLSYNFTSNVKIFATINESVRMPTFTDLYYVGPTNMGNPDLKPEKAVSYELGTKFINNWVNINSSVFIRNSSNVIDWVKRVDSLLWESKNITELTTKGFDFSAIVYTKKLNKNTFPIDYVKVNYSFISTNKCSDDFISYYALDYLKHKFVISAQNRIYKNISASYSFVYQDRAGTYTDFVTGLEKKYKPFSTFDARLFYKTKHSILYLEASNIFNEKYFDLGNVAMPGRWVRCGIKFKLKLSSEQNANNEPFNQ